MTLKKITPFESEIYVTRSLLPSLLEYNKKIQIIWDTKILTNQASLVRELERELGLLLNVKNVTVHNNGTIALMIALKALDIKGEVITTPFTFAATSNVLKWLGIKPVFCDIREDDLTIDETKIEALITENTTAILPVHVFGNLCNVEAIDRIANKYDLNVIYDGAHAFYSQVNGKSVCDYGDITMLSFHATKLFHTAEGGGLITKDPRIKEKIDLLKNFGIENEGNITECGINGKMNELQAAMGLTVLPLLESEREKRIEIKKLYNRKLSEIDGIEIVNKDVSQNDSLQYYVIRINEERFGLSRDVVIEELKKYNVYCKRYFFPLLSNLDYFKMLDSALDLPIANRVVSETLALPFYGQLPVEDVYKICEIIKLIQ